MAFGIGDTTAALGAPRGTPPPPRNSRDESSPNPAGNQGRDPRSARNDELRIGAGFGANTVSLPAAAITTLNRNIEGVRDLLPSAQEIREQIRENLRQQAEQARDAFAERPVENLVGPERVRPEASPQVRNFVDAAPPEPVQQPAPTGLPESAARDNVPLLPPEPPARNPAEAAQNRLDLLV